MNTLPSPRWPRLLATAGAFATCASLGVFLRPTERKPTRPELEEQLQLAVDARAAASVRELGRRLSAVDPTAERQLGLAEVFLGLGLQEEVEHALAAAEKASPTPLPTIEKIRARAAEARSEWAIAAGHWGAYLLSSAAAVPAERAATLDELAQTLVQLHAWQQTRERLNERLALADSVWARMTRATVLTRLREWNRAKADFTQLAGGAAEQAEVKPLLPRWERVERALPELTARDAALEAAPTRLGPRLDRGWSAMEAGLWQNAAEDFLVAMRIHPLTRAGRLLLATLASADDFDHRFDDDPSALLEGIAILTPSESVVAQNARLAENRANWAALRDCDLAIAAATADDAARLALRAEQARLVGKLGHPQRALEDARTLLRSAPGYLPAERVEIAALLALHRVTEADAAVSAVSARQAEEDAAPDFEFDRLAGLVGQAQGKHEAAVERFTRCLDTQRTAELLRARARSLRFLQRFAEASDDFAEAQAIEAKMPEVTP